MGAERLLFLCANLFRETNDNGFEVDVYNK